MSIELLAAVSRIRIVCSKQGSGHSKAEISSVDSGCQEITERITDTENVAGGEGMDGSMQKKNGGRHFALQWSVGLDYFWPHRRDKNIHWIQVKSFSCAHFYKEPSSFL